MKPTLIIVDDLAGIRAHLRELLQEEFEIIAEGADGKAAVELCLRYQPQFVLLDVVMPGMSGIDALHQIMAGPEPHPKVFMLSGVTEESVVLRALQAGAVDYLFKPVNEVKLAAILKGFLPQE